MKVSFDGLFSNVEGSLRTSTDRYAAMMAYSLMEFGDNLRLVMEGKCSLDDFKALYVLSDKPEKMADWVKKENYACMREDDEDEEAA